MRGRKLTAQSVAQHDVLVEIYPREGTETKPSIYHAKYLQVEIYPREGTETAFSPCAWADENVEIYPREGTETQYTSFTLITSLMLKFIPERGRKLENVLAYA